MSVLAPWWGGVTLADGETRRWRLGPCTFWLRRAGQELVLERSEGQDPLATSLERGVLDASPPPQPERLRLLVGAQQRTVRLMPLAADRAVVVRTEDALVLPARSQVTVFVSTPGWVELTCGEAVQSWPLTRLTDTWFGPSTIEGDLGYASATRLRLDVSELVRCPHRLFTRVELHNQGQDALAIRRIRMPLPRLAVYGTPDGLLWTDGLVVRRRSGPAQAEVEVQRAAPSEQATRLAEPRITQSGAGVLSLFTLQA